MEEEKWRRRRRSRTRTRSMRRRRRRRDGGGGGGGGTPSYKVQEPHMWGHINTHSSKTGTASDSLEPNTG